MVDPAAAKINPGEKSQIVKKKKKKKHAPYNYSFCIYPFRIQDTENAD